MRIVAAGVAYFVVVFGAGFALGPVRILWLVPRVGVRAAELLEMPIMLVVIIIAAGWTVRRFAVPRTPSARFSTGFVALALLVSAELMLAFWLQGMTIRENVGLVIRSQERFISRCWVFSRPCRGC